MVSLSVSPRLGPTSATSSNSQDANTRQPGWRARLNLGLVRRREVTVLADRSHYGPLRVQRPFYPEQNGTCHVYVLHPPGGVVGGDQLEINVSLKKAANALMTTPAAGKFYRSVGDYAQQIQSLNVAAGASLEWLPQENIVFSGAKARVVTCVQLQAGARFMGWDITCFGRPACGERFLDGDHTTRFEIWRDGRPLFVERARVEGASELLDARWGMAGLPVTGVFVCVNERRDLVASARLALADQLPKQPGELVSITQLSDVMVCRYLGASTERAKLHFTRLWQFVRPHLLDQPACRPRIWDT